MYFFVLFCKERCLQSTAKGSDGPHCPPHWVHSVSLEVGLEISAQCKSPSKQKKSIRREIQEDRKDLSSSKWGV